MASFYPESQQRVEWSNEDNEIEDMTELIDKPCLKPTAGLYSDMSPISVKAHLGWVSVSYYEKGADLPMYFEKQISSFNI